MVSPIRMGGEEPKGVEPDLPEGPPPPPSVGAVIKPKMKASPPTFRGGDFSDGLIDNDDDDITIDVDKTTGEVVISHTEEIVKTPGTYDEDGEELTPPVLEYVVRSATFTPLDIIPTSYAETPSREVKSGKIVRRKRLLRNENDEIKVRVEKTGQYDWIPEEEFDEALHERIYEEFDVELEKTEPSKAVMTTGKKSVTIIAAKNVLKETILLDTYSKRSIRWNVVLDKMVLKKHGEMLQAYKEDGKTKLPFKLPAPTASNMVQVHWYWGVSTGDLRIAFDTLAADIKFPLEIDPTFSFDGTDFVISSAQTEVKTYQNIGSWGVFKGTNARYNAGYAAIDSNGTQVDIYISSPSFIDGNLTGFSDFTITVKTTNADADWVLQVYWLQSGLRYFRWDKTLSGDVDATYSMSDFSEAHYGDADWGNIGAVYVKFAAIDGTLAGNVTAEIKDLKFTTPVKTSDFYDDTGRFVLASENCEGDDSLPLDDYDSAWTVATAGTSLIEIDTAQYASGTSSIHLKNDGTNVPNAILTMPTTMGADFMRFSFKARVDDALTWLEVDLMESGDYYCPIRFMGSADIFSIFYGDGAGGSNEVTLACVIDNWYEIWMDIDVANDAWRCWIDGVMYPGPNADARGFDNLYQNDAFISAINQVRIWNRKTGDGEKNSWMDDLKWYAGFEDFSALTAPHDIDDICEAVSPSGTDYGRGTWDGDWATNGVSIAADNTKAVIGTNSIKANDLDYIQLVSYAYDAAIDISSFTNMRFYCFPETGMTTIRIYLYCTTGGSREISVTVTPNKWNYVDLDINGAWSGWDETGSFNATIHHQLFIMNFTGATSNLDLWIDGFHFYGDPAAGTCWMGNKLDPNNNDYTQDRAMYNFHRFDDNGGTDFGTWKAVMSSADDNLTVEWSDDSTPGVNNGDFATGTTQFGTIELTGYDENNPIIWTSVGDVAVTNRWECQESNSSVASAKFIFQNVAFKYYYRVCSRNSGTSIINFTGSPKDQDNCVGLGLMTGALYRNITIDISSHTSGNQYATGILTSGDIYVYNSTILRNPDEAGIFSFTVWASTEHGTVYFVNSNMDMDNLRLLGDEKLTIVSRRSRETTGYIIAVNPSYTGDYGISDVAEAHRPNQLNDVSVVAGTLRFDTDLNMVRDLTIDSGVTIDNSSGKLLILGVLTNNGTRNDTADDTYCMLYELPLPVPESIAYELNGRWKI